MGVDSESVAWRASDMPFRYKGLGFVELLGVEPDMGTGNRRPAGKQFQTLYLRIPRPAGG